MIWDFIGAHPLIAMSVVMLLAVWAVVVAGRALFGLGAPSWLKAPKWLVQDDPEPERDTKLSPRDTEKLLRLHSFSTPARKGFRRHGDVVPISRVNDRRIFETMKRAR